MTKYNSEHAASAAELMDTNSPTVFWKDDWALKGLDTSAGRELITRGVRHIKQSHERIEVDPSFDWRASNPLYASVESEDADDGD